MNAQFSLQDKCKSINLSRQKYGSSWLAYCYCLHRLKCNKADLWRRPRVQDLSQGAGLGLRGKNRGKVATKGTWPNVKDGAGLYMTYWCSSYVDLGCFVVPPGDKCGHEGKINLPAQDEDLIKINYSGK